MPGKKKILVIDDNKDILFMLTAMLEFKDFETCARMGVTDLEETITSFQPDAILMDMILSGVDGRNVCRSLKENKLFARFPVIMISAHPDAREECLEAGASQFLEKPFDMDDFYNVVEEVLKGGKTS